MLTGLKPFDGSSLGAVCAQILNADPVPPSRHNPALPQALDLIIARCLAKNPKDRFASCDELASALYPLARSRPPSAAPKTRKPIWWTQPVAQRDVWITAAACLLIAASVQVSRPFRARFVHPLPAGSHQFRVALYKPDKSLRLEKEGLAEIRSDLANTLAAHVTRHSKLLVRHEQLGMASYVRGIPSCSWRTSSLEWRVT